MIDIGKHFHTIGVREALYSLKTSRAGLYSEEVEKRLNHFGGSGYDPFCRLPTDSEQSFINHRLIPNNVVDYPGHVWHRSYFVGNYQILVFAEKGLIFKSERLV